MSVKKTDTTEWDPRPDQIRFLRVFSLALQLSLTRAMLVVLGFQRTARICDFFGRTSLRQTETGPRQIEALVYEVSLAAALIPARVLCLERSLVLFRQLKPTGAPVTLRLGACVRPFNAHAWVDLDGVPIYEDPDRLKEFQPIFELN